MQIYFDVASLLTYFDAAGLLREFRKVMEGIALATVGESWGLAGIVVVVLLLLVSLIVRSLEWTEAHASQPEGLLMASLTLLLLIQVILPVDGMTGVLPFTGLTFPFLSRGGASLLSNLVVVGIMAGLSVNGGGRDSARAQTDKTLRRGIAAAFAPMLLALALVQLGGRSLAPDAMPKWLDDLAYLRSTNDQWQVPPYREVLSSITDRGDHIKALKPLDR